MKDSMKGGPIDINNPKRFAKVKQSPSEKQVMKAALHRAANPEIKRPQTKRQKAFFKHLPTSKSAAEAARKAGYAEKSARVSAHDNITKYNGHWRELLDAAGCNEAHMAGTIAEGTQAVKVLGYLQPYTKGKQKIEAAETVSNDFVETPDWPARAKFIELAAKLRDDFPESKLKVTTDPPPPDTGALDQIVAGMKPAEQREFITMLAGAFGA